MKSYWSKALIVSLANAAAAMALSQSMGDLIVSPTRILLDEKTKSTDVMLVNRSTKAIRYRLNIVEMEMSEDGLMKRVQGTDHSAAGILRLSPREVLLEPGDSQRIKIAAIFPIGSPDVELRSHLAFEPISTARPPQQGSEAGQDLKIRLELRSVITIPVIARHGRLSAEATISDAAIVQDKDGWVAKFKLGRTGNRSVRGDVTVFFQPANGGAKVSLGQIVALPVYFPNTDRVVTVRLTRDIRGLGKGAIEVRFAEPERSRGAATARSVVELST